MNRECLSGLFPDLRSSQCSDKSDSADSLPEKDGTQRVSGESDSCDFAFLQELLSGLNSEEAILYREKLAEQQFYLSDRFVRKMGTLTTDAKTVPATGDFEQYNTRVHREFELRKKLDGLLKQRSLQPLNILSSDDLSARFVAGQDNDISAPQFWHERSILANVVKSPLETTGKTPLRSSNQNRHNGPDLRIARTDSHETQIIDMEKDLNGIIDMSLPEGSRKIGGFASSRGGGIGKSTNGSPQQGASSSEGQILQRRLERRHLQAIATGATIGVGLFLNSGKALSIGGPFGSLIGFSICASVVLATTLSFTEIATVIPIASGVSGLASRFVEDAFGFALGWTYWLTYSLTLANQIVASNYMLSYYSNESMSTGATAGFISLFLIVIVSVNLLDVRLVGEISFGFTFLKITICTIMVLVMIALNAGAGSQRHSRIGFRFWDSSKSPENLTFGLFRPTFDLQDVGTGSKGGISGAKGRFLSVLVVVILSSFSFSGVEVGFVACGEATNPRHSLPPATKRTFATITSIYLISTLVIGINVYSGDSRLLRYYISATQNPASPILSPSTTSWQMDHSCDGDQGTVDSAQVLSSGNQSPWILALNSFGLCTFSSVFNAFLAIFGVSSAFSSLYAASRTLYSMSTQDKSPSVFKRCTGRGVPYMAVMFTGLVGSLAYLALNSHSLEIFQALANMSSATIAIIWFGLNVSFLRYYYALKRRPEIISRDDPSYPYKSPLQPFAAYYGLFGSTVIVLLMGFSNFLKGFWNTKMAFSSYGGVIFFVVNYAGFKLLRNSKLQRLDQLDLDTGRREGDRLQWSEHQQYNNSWSERFKNMVTWII
ncbi:LADA_0G06150g1_1 [Lachancea dasiensis]|uniref:LADA_0G06150g1_1 n=1 Tax=Lachancea dasiensis TaxID=1072105 RepID=A0A1G4JTG1_9SACH|nr:LADA_0G06150g1_1 [Lachancea dasiensis]